MKSALRQKWFQFRLRTLLLLTLVFALPLYYFSNRLHAKWDAERRKKILDVLALNGCQIWDPRLEQGVRYRSFGSWYKLTYEGITCDKLSSTQLKFMLKKLASYNAPIGVNIVYSQVTDEVMTQLKNIPELVDLQSYGNLMFDNDLKCIGAAKDLISLVIVSGGITDQGVSYLSNLHKLSELLLASQSITDNSLIYIANMTNLTHLSLGGTSIKGSGLQYIADLAWLEYLELSCTNVTDLGLQYLKKLPLVKLNLGYTKITDTGMESLCELHTLEELKISHTAVSDVGVRKLVSKLNLKVIWIAEEQLSKTLIAELRQKGITVVLF